MFVLHWLVQRHLATEPHNKMNQKEAVDKCQNTHHLRWQTLPQHGTYNLSTPIQSRLSSFGVSSLQPNPHHPPRTCTACAPLHITPTHVPTAHAHLLLLQLCRRCGVVFVLSSAHRGLQLFGRGAILTGCAAAAKKVPHLRKSPWRQGIKSMTKGSSRWKKDRVHGKRLRLPAMGYQKALSLSPSQTQALAGCVGQSKPNPVLAECI